ncbi:inositol 2-dehydrogenase [Phytomonospora sp. NPDC050363]|uniref:inositol 2-dehydrogenase n=1 Tax=Phytomonospora sp. NPDC050363 TaxID=3155642 RepID=UPI0033C2E9CF
MLRIGIVGTGHIGEVHALNVAAHPLAHLVAAASLHGTTAGKVARRSGAQHRGVEAVLDADDIDAVIIATPTDTHAGLIERAAAAGKAIFCEKPVDLDVERTRACLRAVQSAKVPLMIGFNRRFDGNFAELKRQLDAGAVGDCEMVTILSRDPQPPPAEYLPGSGGLFRDMTIHDFDMARHLLNEEPVSVYAVGSALVDPDLRTTGHIDTASVTLTTRSGRIAHISNSRRATYGYDQRIEVHGSEGMLRAENLHTSTVEKAGAGGFTRAPLLPFFPERYSQAFRAEIDAFITAVLAGTAIAPSGEDGLRAQILADAAVESQLTGTAVRIG